MQKLLILAFAAIFCVASVAAIDCYVCEGKDFCDRPAQVKCEPRIKGCVTAATDIAPYIVRGCADSGSGDDYGFNGCADTVYQGNKARFCECQDKDLCNDKNIVPSKNVKTINYGPRQMSKIKDAWAFLINKH